MSPLEALIEKEAIRELRTRYSHYYDGQEVERLVDLFTDDAVCEFGEDFGGDWVGKAAIEAKFRQYMSQFPYPYALLHSVTNPLIELIDGQSAHGRWYLHDLRTTEGADDPHILYGIYDDVYRKIDGRWLFHRTRIDFLWPRRQYLGPREPMPVA